jgi:hypothetical protein
MLAVSATLGIQVADKNNKEKSIVSVKKTDDRNFGIRKITNELPDIGEQKTVVIVRSPDSGECYRLDEPANPTYVAKNSQCSIAKNIGEMRNQISRNRLIQKYFDCLKKDGKIDEKDRNKLIKILKKSLDSSLKSKSKYGAIYPAAKLLVLGVKDFKDQLEAMKALQAAMKGDCGMCRKAAKKEIKQKILFGPAKGETIEEAYFSVPKVSED